MMKERIPAWALYRLRRCALRPVAVPNGNKFGLLRASWPIGRYGFDDYSEGIPKRMQPLNAWHMVHHAKGIAIQVEPSRCQTRPGGDAYAYKPSFKPSVAPISIGSINWIIAAVAWIKLSE